MIIILDCNESENSSVIDFWNNKLNEMVIRKAKHNNSFGVSAECPKFTYCELESGILYFDLLLNVLSTLLYPDNVNHSPFT